MREEGWIEPPNGHPLRTHWPWSALALGLMSALVTFIVWNRWVGPVDTIPMQPSDAPDYWGGSSLLWLIAPIPVVALTYRWPRWWVGIVTALIPATAMIGVAIGISDEFRWQRQAHDVFIAYTHRFPPGKLGESEIVEQYESVIGMCADIDPRPGYVAEKRFCVSMEMDHPRGEQVTGGFKVDGMDWYERTDCWGDEIDWCRQ